MQRPPKPNSKARCARPSRRSNWGAAARARRLSLRARALSLSLAQRHSLTTGARRRRRRWQPRRAKYLHVGNLQARTRLTEYTRARAHVENLQRCQLTTAANQLAVRARAHSATKKQMRVAQKLYRSCVCICSAARQHLGQRMQISLDSFNSKIHCCVCGAHTLLSRAPIKSNWPLRQLERRRLRRALSYASATCSNNDDDDARPTHTRTRSRQRSKCCAQLPDAICCSSGSRRLFVSNGAAQLERSSAHI